MLPVLLLFVFFIGKTQTTDAYIDSLAKALTTAKDDTDKVKLLMELGNNVGYYDANKALEYAKQGLALSKKINYPTGMARTTYLLGNTYLDLSDYNQSKARLDESERMFISLNRKDMIGMINNARGNWYYMQSDMWNASHYYTKAVEIFHQLGDTAKEMFPYNNLIAALGEIKNYGKAISLSQKLLVQTERMGDSVQVAHTLNHLVFNNVALGQMGEAKKYIPSLLTYIQQSLDHNLAAESYNVVGSYHYKNGLYDTALHYYQLALSKALRDNYQTALYNQSIGAAYLKKNELQRAFQHLSMAVKLARQANSKDVYYQTCLYLSEYYDKTNNYKEAYNYLQEYRKLNDSILVAETRQYSTHLEAVYENSKKEQEILRLNTAELEKSLAIKRRNTFLYIAAAFVVLLVLLFVLQIKNAANKRGLLEKDRRLQEEKIVSLEKQQQVTSLQSMIAGQEAERTRIARDLHDGLGGLFSTVKMYFSSLGQDAPALKDNPLFIKSFELADTASVELRRIAHNLMPEVLMKLGLINAIQDLCNTINAGRLLSITVQSYGMEKRLPENMEIMLFRIVQELLNNIIKHSQATEVIIQFNKHSDRLSITIEDNGRGFNIDEVDTKNKAGIGTIKSRVNYLNGKLNIDSKQGVGTTVAMEFLMAEDSNGSIS